MFKLVAPYAPSGDQIEAIPKILENLKNGIKDQVILGVTGSGKTFTMANIIEQSSKPTIIMAPNKTLAAQLYSEFRDFFPENAVEYFVSYYDYYQPEAYVAARDLYIEKDASINEHIEQMRLSATKALLERRDVIIVSTVSSIYGLGNPRSYHEMILSVRVNQKIKREEIIKKLIKMQYTRTDLDFQRGHFRVKGDVIDVFPSENSNEALRIELFDDEVEQLSLFDSLTGKIISRVLRYNVYPASHYVTTSDAIKIAIEKIKIDLDKRLKVLKSEGKVVEAQRLETRTNFDIEMMEETGFCKGIENYSWYLSDKKVGDPPDTLFDYLPSDSLLIIDESHIMMGQIGAMYKGDRSRKQNLVDFGFRLPSALDNRPLKFEEFEKKMPASIYVSATPGEYEKIKSGNAITELVIRPTGILDPLIEIKPATGQIEDLLGEIDKTIKNGCRVLVTTLTKKMSEQVQEFLAEQKIKSRYLHSDINNVERVEILRDLRLGVFDVLVGINLLREGLDLPEVQLVAILDADKEGFLRSDRSLIQTIGRAARNPNGRVILYADKTTDSMKRAIDETKRRRVKQEKYNLENNITPSVAVSKIKELIDGVFTDKKENTKGKIDKKEAVNYQNITDVKKALSENEKKMKEAAQNLDFEKAALFRDEIKRLKELLLNF